MKHFNVYDEWRDAIRLPRKRIVITTCTVGFFWVTNHLGNDVLVNNRIQCRMCKHKNENFCRDGMSETCVKNTTATLEIVANLGSSDVIGQSHVSHVNCTLFSFQI